MAVRATLSISEPNAKWIQAQIDSKEFSSRSEVLNDLIRKTRKSKRCATAQSSGRFRSSEWLGDKIVRRNA